MKASINKAIKKPVFILLTLLIMPSALAYTARTGITPLNTAIEMISNLFNIEVLKNAYIQEGFLKFALFIFLFAVTNMALKKVKIFDKKTAGIVSFAFSMIGVFMMPTPWLMATGGLITVIMSSLIFLGFFIGLAYLAMFKLRKNWIENMLGLLLLMFLIFMIGQWSIYTGLPLIMIIKNNWMKKIFTQ